MSKSMMNPVPTNQEGDKSDWKIKTAANGLLFYFNTKSKRSQWEKPDVLKTPEEKLNSTDWQEHTTADGKVFYYNQKLKQSVWRMPPELKAVKEKQAELRKQMEKNDVQKPANSKISVSFTSNIPAAEEPEDDSAKYDNLPHEEAVKIFMELLKDKVSPSMKWEQAQLLIKSDERIKVIKAFSEQRRLFKDWVSQTRVQERQEYKQRVQRARENFRQMLEEKGALDSDSKYYKVFHLFMNDPRWKALEDREREQTFQEHLDDLFEKEKDERITKTKQYREELKKILSSDHEVTPLTKWDDICEKYKDKVAWTELNENDRLQVFSKWIIELDRLEYEEKRKGKRHQERKNREAFRDLLKEHIDKGTLTHKTKWRHFVQLIKEDKRLYNMLGQNGSSPRELFEDQLEILKDQYKRTKDDLKKVLKVLKDTSFKVTTETTFESFDSGLKSHAEYDGLDQKTKEYFYRYYVDKAKAKEKENQKKYRRLLKKYTRFLKNTLEVKPDSEYKTFEKEINENEQFNSIKEADRISLFVTFVHELKNQDEGQISDEAGEKGKKKKSKKKRKHKKKANSSEDEKARGDSSDDSQKSDSRSPSRSHSKDHKRKSKKDKKKTDKRSRSESEDESDAEKKPDKKVFTEKDQSIQPQPVPEPQLQPQTQPQPQPQPQPQTLPVSQALPQPQKVAGSEVPVQSNEKAMNIEKTSKPNAEHKPNQNVVENKILAEESKKEEVKVPDASKVIEEGQITVNKKGEADKEDPEEREEGETKESLPRKKSVSKSSRSRSRSRSESRDRDRHRKKKERKHSKKKSRKGDKKSKKKHRKRSYTPSGSSDGDD